MARGRREGLFWRRFTRKEQRALAKAGFRSDGTRTAEADGAALLDEEVTVLHVLILRLLDRVPPEEADEDVDPTGENAPMILRLAAEIGRLIRTRELLSAAAAKGGTAAQVAEAADMARRFLDDHAARSGRDK